MTEKHWFAERRLGPREYERCAGQPEGGFETITDAMDWLAAQGHIVDEGPDDEGLTVWRGWGTEFFIKGTP